MRADGASNQNSFGEPRGWFILQADCFIPSEMGEEEEGNYGAELEMGQGLEAEQLGRTPVKLNVDNGKSSGCD